MDQAKIGTQCVEFGIHKNQGQLVGLWVVAVVFASLQEIIIIDANN